MCPWTASIRAFCQQVVGFCGSSTLRPAPLSRGSTIACDGATGQNTLPLADRPVIWIRKPLARAVQASPKQRSWPLRFPSSGLEVERAETCEAGLGSQYGEERLV